MSLELGRRGLFRGLGGLLAAPAIVQVTRLMPISAPKLVLPGNGLLTIDLITREAVRLWKNSNAFLQQIDLEYDALFVNSQIGSSLRIKLPTEWSLPK